MLQWEKDRLCHQKEEYDIVTRKTVLILLALILIASGTAVLLSGGGNGGDNGMTRFRTRSSSYDIRVQHAKTAEQIATSEEKETSYTVEGKEISLIVSEKENRALLEEKGYDKYWYHEPDDPSGYRYGFVFDEKESGTDTSFVRYGDSGDVLWSVPLWYDAWDFRIVSDGVIIFGVDKQPMDTPTSSDTPQNAHLTKTDPEGNILWSCTLEHGLGREEVYQVLEEENGYAVVSRGGFTVFNLSHLSSDGRQLSHQATIVGNYGFWDLAANKDGYLVQFGSFLKQRYAEIAWTDPEGWLLDFRQYSEAGHRFYLKDMTVRGDELYCSGYFTPVPQNGSSNAKNGEVDLILDHIFGNDLWEIDSKELTPLVQENYTAVLLVCDAQTGEPKRFLSVPGSLGKELYTDEQGQLFWYTEAVEDAYFSPATNSFTIGGASIVYRLSIGENGNVKDIMRTGEVRAFRAG